MRARDVAALTCGDPGTVVTGETPNLIHKPYTINIKVEVGGWYYSGHAAPADSGRVRCDDPGTVVTGSLPPISQPIHIDR